MADFDNTQDHNISRRKSRSRTHQSVHASQLGGGDNTYMIDRQNPAMYPQDLEQSAMDPHHEMMMNNTSESVNMYEPMDNFPVEALMPFNQGLAAFAGEEVDTRGQKLKETRLMEALERQTTLLDSIAQGYQKNRELRHKADLRKLKNRLETLENQKLFRELEIQQMQAANDIAQQNNQLIFSHLNAQAQLKANPIVLNMAPRLPPFALPQSLPSLNNPLAFSLPPLSFPGMPRPLGYGPGPQWGPHPMTRPPTFFGAHPAGPRSGPMPLNIPPMGFNKGVLKLPPITTSRRNRKKDDSDSSDSDSDDESMKGKSKRKHAKKVNVDKYLDKVFGKSKKHL